MGLAFSSWWRWLAGVAGLVLLGACAAGERDFGGGGAGGDGYLSENLIGNPALELERGGPVGWTFLADDGVVARGSVREEEGWSFLHTDVDPGSGPGHARWWFEPVQLSGGRFYEYTDSYRSYGTGRLIWSCEADGARRFHWAGQSSSSPTWSRTAFRFFVPADCLATVMHLLDRPGYLDTRLHALREVAPAPLEGAWVSIAFDDGNESHFHVAARELEEHGVRGTFYLVTDWLGRGGYLSWEQAGEMAAKGHEIGSHTASHRPLTEVPAGQLRDEVEGSLLQLARVGAAGGLAYPFGDFDEVVEPYAASRARYVRTSLEGMNDATLDPTRIRVFPVTAATTAHELERAVDDAVRARGWQVFLFHDLGEPVESDPYRTDPALLRGLLGALHERDVSVLPVVEVVEALGR